VEVRADADAAAERTSGVRSGNVLACTFQSLTPQQAEFRDDVLRWVGQMQDQLGRMQGVSVPETGGPFGGT
jgi:hypothetical protein